MTMPGKTLYEEVWECHIPKRQTTEEEILELQALIPDIMEDVRSLFKEAVTDSIANLLDENEARALVILVSGPGFESPAEVYEELDSILRSGSRIVKEAIVEEFRINVHLLLEKVKRNISAIESVFQPLAPMIS